ncbi:hypothetical protein CXB51_035209 [Gossypium anomalum]|uniref:Uncharacterized protein n=1 Tax=Gossypium anomalum TaxID=47600 RepID=A0A8J6CMK6_9ROSI|nr:hypothetical protein CXB51_035209 [Gossypium anomalum]
MSCYGPDEKKDGQTKVEKKLVKRLTPLGFLLIYYGYKHKFAFIVIDLEKDKLDGLNFLNWFRNLRIVIKQEHNLYVIEQSLPNEPPINASRADRDVYKKHLDDMVDIGCLILATMNPKLQKQHEDMVACDMIEYLKELYQGQARQERFDTSKALFQCNMKKIEPKPILMVHNKKGKGKAKAKTKPKGKDIGKGTALSIFRKSRIPKQAERLL